jgi:hypothetical protein
MWLRIAWYRFTDVNVDSLISLPLLVYVLHHSLFIWFEGRRNMFLRNVWKIIGCIFLTINVQSISFLVHFCRWLGSELTHKQFSLLQHTWSPRIIALAWRTAITGRGIFRSGTWGNLTVAGTCVRSTRIPWRVKWATWRWWVSVQTSLV